MTFDASTEPLVVRHGDTSGVPFGSSGRGRLRIYSQRPEEPGFALVDAAHQPGEPTIRNHVHSRHDETFIVLGGTYRIRLNQEVVIAQSGEIVFVPRGTAHTFRNVDTSPGRLLNSVTPAHGVELLRELAELMRNGPTEEALIEIHGRHGRPSSTRYLTGDLVGTLTATSAGRDVSRRAQNLRHSGSRSDALSVGR